MMLTAKEICSQWLTFLHWRLEVPGLTVGVARSQEEWILSVGSADRESAAPISDATLLPIASITKIFTAVAIMQLCEQKQLELRTPVSQILPEFRASQGNRDSVTIEHLLAHTSGIAREVDEKCWNSYQFPSRAELLKHIEELPEFFPPGERFKYSNLGSALLGEIIERVTGCPYEKVIEDRILKPLKLQHTFVRIGSENPNLATGYDAWRPEAAREKFQFLDFKGLTPSAGIVSTVRDLLVFLKLWIDPEFGENVLTLKSREEMLRSRWRDSASNVGRNLFSTVSERMSETVYSAYGWLPGYRCHITIVPAQKLRTFVFCNAQDLSSISMGMTIADTFLRYSSASEVSPELTPFVGSYESIWGRILILPFELEKLLVVGIEIGGPEEWGYIVPSKILGFKYLGHSGTGSLGERAALAERDSKPGIFIGDSFFTRRG